MYNSWSEFCVKYELTRALFYCILLTNLLLNGYKTKRSEKTMANNRTNNQQSNQQTNRQSNQQTNRQSNQQTNRQSNQQTNQQSNNNCR